MPELKIKHQSQQTLLSASKLSIYSVTGRELFNDLDVQMEYEQVALVGRNGVGKSTLMHVLAGMQEPESGVVNIHPESLLISQRIEGLNADIDEGQSAAEYIDALFVHLNLFKLDINRHFSEIGLRPYQQMRESMGFSFGELRKLHLLNALFRRPHLLLLDEPSQDLDETGLNWLKRFLTSFKGGVMLCSDDKKLLSLFEHFFVIEDTGCHYFKGNFDTLLEYQQKAHELQQKQYLQGLRRLENEEAHFRKVSYRREQKKNQGRWREIDRGSPRSVLNGKRSCAQQSQARLAAIRGNKIDSARALTKASRQALSVSLPLKMLLPNLPKVSGQPIVSVNGLSYAVDGRQLFSDLSLNIARERIALVGANGSGKTTLLNIIAKALKPQQGSVKVMWDKVGYVAQGGSNWMLDESVLEKLLFQDTQMDIDKAIALLMAYKFPLPLAERPMASLAPGERTRAALLCILAKNPSVELLILDEPGNSLDLVAQSALKEGLKAWQGGFIIAGHDKGFFEEIGVDEYVRIE